MDIKKLSFFVIAVGVILVALGGGNWVVVENSAKQEDNFRQAKREAGMEATEWHSSDTGEQAIAKLRARQRLLHDMQEESEMASLGYTIRAETDHTFPYSLMISGMLVIIIGIGMRVSSSRKSDAEKVA